MQSFIEEIVDSVHAYICGRNNYRGALSRSANTLSIASSALKIFSWVHADFPELFQSCYLEYKKQMCGWPWQVPILQGVCVCHALGLSSLATRSSLLWMGCLSVWGLDVPQQMGQLLVGTGA